METDVDICEIISSGENEFYYTQDRQIRKIDDSFILSKITEKYPDLNPGRSEHLLKQVVVVIANDGKLISEIESLYGVGPMDLFLILYRNFEYIFNGCLIAKLHRIIRNKAYANRIKGTRNHSMRKHKT